ncbi:nascent polypeptide-associated complex subunit alpha, muscle-specific form-like [Equus caballus]|uniref:nascent polypeptide-associated complex subunit alpha, muscle-specific form-like n=1 Tax=Equus caballus TaxID=9796 RepID=UPI0038B2ED7A
MTAPTPSAFSGVTRAWLPRHGAPRPSALCLQHNSTNESRDGNDFARPAQEGPGSGGRRVPAPPPFSGQGRQQRAQRARRRAAGHPLLHAADGGEGGQPAAGRGAGVIPDTPGAKLEVRGGSRPRCAETTPVCPKQLPRARDLPPPRSATGSAASPSAIRDPAKQYVRRRAAQRSAGQGSSDGGPAGARQHPRPEKLGALGPRRTGGSAARQREGELRHPSPTLPPPRRKEKCPATSRRPGPAAPAPATPAPGAASPSPPGLALAPAALRAAREGASDMSGARRSPRGPDAAAATAARRGGLIPVAPASASSSGGCAAPSHPHYRRTRTGKTAGLSLTRFWLRLRGTNLPSPGPPPFGNTHNSARSSPGFSAGEEEEAEAAAARPSPARPRPPRPHWLEGRAGRGASGASIGYLCPPSGPPWRGWSERLSVRRRPRPRRFHSTPPAASPPLSAASAPCLPPPPTPPPPRVRQGQAARAALPVAPAAGSAPGGRGTLRGPEQPERLRPGPPALARAWAPGPLRRLPTTLPEERRGLDVPNALPGQFLEAPREGRARAGAGARQSGRLGQQVKWIPERPEESGSASTLASPPWGIVPPPPVMAAGGDDVLHFVGTAVGTWDQFKRKPRGAGKLVPGKPQLDSAIRPEGTAPASSVCIRGALGHGTGATAGRPGRRCPPPSTKMEEAAGAPGAGLPPVGRPEPPLGVSLGAAVLLLRSLSRSPSLSLHPASPPPSTLSWSSTIDGGSTARRAQSLRPPGAGPAGGAGRRGCQLPRAPGRPCAERPQPPRGFSFVPRLHLRLGRTSWCCAISKIPRKDEREASSVSP